MDLELRIPTNFINSYPPPTSIPSNKLADSEMTTGLPNPTSSSVFTRLLSGPLDSFLPYVGQEHSKWLIDIAHDICDPTLKRGTLKVWDAAGEMWKKVNPTDPLAASIYVYDTCAIVSLTMISERTGRSKATTTGNDSAMAKRVKQRDGHVCWVTRFRPTINTHLCPKRMGDHMLRVVYDTFVSTPPPALSTYDEICGIALHPSLNIWFNMYECGLWYVAPDEYECHDFVSLNSQDWRVTILGAQQTNSADPPMPLLHRHRVRPPQPQHPHNPPPGLFRWHYIQCVIRKFAHSDYQSLQNIFYPELPLRMEGDSDSDSDDEGTESEYEWPSAALDHRRLMASKIREARARVAEWATRV